MITVTLPLEEYEALKKKAAEVLSENQIWNMLGEELIGIQHRWAVGGDIYDRSDQFNRMMDIVQAIRRGRVFK